MAQLFSRMVPAYAALCLALASCASNKQAASTHHNSSAGRRTSSKFIDSVQFSSHNARRNTTELLTHTSRTSPSTEHELAPEAADEKAEITEQQNSVSSEPEPAGEKNVKTATHTSKTTVVPAAKHGAGKTNIPDNPGDDLITRYAAMIAMDPREMSNYPLYHFVDDWYGTLYKWGGNDMDGIDCSGFSQRLYDDVYGVDLLRTVRQQRRSCDRVKSGEDAKQGDLVFFRIRKFRVSHVGVYLANGYFVHASSSHGVVISNVHERYWHRRFAGYGRIEKDSGASESDYQP